ncbi:MAG: RIP metalloprotease RseP [Cytophagaceae bacterium]|nr:RIP metalloprotease RseP [Cytophagaceae bacterium]MDW8455499.1 RIP metalloprotease RseP [Cytophagaceae bacterium]
MSSVNWVQIAQLFISLSILIVLHEFGHYAAARIFKTRVEKFYLFFDFLFPFPNMLNFALFKKKKGDTEYGIGWFPLGGYVKIAGMADESMDKEQLKQPPQPWEYRSKPAWQRLIIIMGGIIVNFMLGVFIYTIVLATWGERYLPNENVKYGIMCDSLAMQAGLQNGDKILSIDNKKVENFYKIPHDMIISQAKTIQVLRNGRVQNIEIPENFIKDVLRKNPKGFIAPRFPFVIEDFDKKSLAPEKGLKKGDKLIGVNNTYTNYFDDFRAEIQKNKEKEVVIHALRNNDTVHVSMTVPASGILGIRPVSDEAFLKYEVINYSFWQAIPAGFLKTFSVLGSYIAQFKLIFSPKVEGYKHIGGFGSMTKLFPQYFTIESFLLMTALISVILAFMNFLPIPMLDGGYVIFILYEMITGKEPNEKLMEYLNYAGMIFLFGLMIYANANDIFGFFK